MEMHRRRGKIRRWFVLLAGMAICIGGCGSKATLLYVNEEAVSEEELALLDQDVAKAVRMKVLQQWAEECGITESAFSYEEMLRQMEEENQSRAAKKAEGGIIYGVTEYTPLQYYNIRMGEYERALKDEMIQAASEEELEAWYQANREDYWQMGEVSAAVTVRSDGRVVNREEITLNSYNYRTLSEGNEELAAVLEKMNPGEEAVWTDENGMEWHLYCTGRAEGSYQLFEDVKGAVSEQYAAEKLKQELDERVGRSEIEDLRQSS